ncbi:MAG: ribbon-helix-helix domain-containing protein [Acidobacteriia bacterium]|nr:ribbon-helix-helix domain-containing protein [Terriglobia bacterium]
MATDRITIRIPESLGTRLRRQSRARGQTPSELVRVALENYLDSRKGRRSAYELAEQAGIIGCAPGLPKDLSTNPRYFAGFGKGK